MFIHLSMKLKWTKSNRKSNCKLLKANNSLVFVCFCFIKLYVNIFARITNYQFKIRKNKHTTQTAGNYKYI